MPLSDSQRRHLRGLAHHLKPVVMVGQDGLKPSVLAEVDGALTAHELIKVKLLETAPVEKGEVGPWLAERCGAHHVGTVGRTVMLYRRHRTTPQVPLPQARKA